MKIEVHLISTLVNKSLYYYYYYYYIFSSDQHIRTEDEKVPFSQLLESISFRHALTRVKLFYNAELSTYSGRITLNYHSSKVIAF